jgi:hypothetical protein
LIALLSVEAGIPVSVLLREPENHLNAMLHYVFNKQKIWNDFQKRTENPWDDLDHLL